MSCKVKTFYLQYEIDSDILDKKKEYFYDDKILEQKIFVKSKLFEKQNKFRDRLFPEMNGWQTHQLEMRSMK